MTRSRSTFCPCRQEEKKKRSAEVEKALRNARGDEAMVATVRRRAERDEAKHKVYNQPANWYWHIFYGRDGGWFCSGAAASTPRSSSQMS